MPWSASLRLFAGDAGAEIVVPPDAAAALGHGSELAGGAASSASLRSLVGDAWWCAMGAVSLEPPATDAVLLSAWPGQGFGCRRRSGLVRNALACSSALRGGMSRKATSVKPRSTHAALFQPGLV